MYRQTLPDLGNSYVLDGLAQLEQSIYMVN